MEWQPQPSAPTQQQPSAPTQQQPHILNTNWIEVEKKHYQSMLYDKDSNMICQNPEHHNISDKVNHFTIQNSKC